MDPLLGSGAPFHQGCRGIRSQPMGLELSSDQLQPVQAHIKHHRQPGIGQGLPGQGQGAVLEVAGDKDTGLGMVPMGQGDTGIGRTAAGGSDTRHHLKGNTLPRQGLNLLAASAEDKRIASLQTQHLFALAGKAYQQPVDIRLGHWMAPLGLAHVDPFRPGIATVQHLLGHQPVIDYHLGLLQQPVGLEGQQFRIPGPPTHQPDLPGGGTRLCLGLKADRLGLTPGFQGLPLEVGGQLDLLIGQIAARILGPGIPAGLIGPYPGVATTDILIATGPAAALKGPGPGLKTGHQGIRSIGPDLGEGPLLDVAQVVVPPEGVRVDIAQVVDIGDIDSGGIAPPAGQPLAHLRHPLGKAFFHPLKQIDPVGIVVAGDILPYPTAGLDLVPAGVEQQIHGLAGHLKDRIVLTVVIAPSGVVEVGQIELIHVLLGQKLQQLGQLMGIVPGQGKAQPHLDTPFPA